MPQKHYREDSVQAIPGPSRRSLHGLDWLNFFVADVQTGLGPFVAVYLEALHWNQEEIGWMLTASALAGVVSQGPAGALVDASKRKRALIAGAIAAITVAALVLALSPNRIAVISAQIAHGIAGSFTGPAIAAVTLGLVGYSRLSGQIGRNNRFNSAGNAFAAAAMGLIGLVALRLIFILSALFAIPALVALAAINSAEIDYERARGATPDHSRARGPQKYLALLENSRLMIFAGCAVIFHFANAAMLPLLGMMLARTRPQDASLFMSVCIITTQVVIALIASPIGRGAERWGRKPVLLLGFGVLPLRGLLYTLTHNPYLLVAIQILDGIGAGVFGVASILVIADVTQGSGRFNAAQGLVSTAVGIGASISTTAAGYVVQRFGFSSGFLFLAMVAFGAFLLLAIALPETGER